MPLFVPVWLSAWFDGNLADAPKRPEADSSGSFDAMPVILWSVQLPGVPAATATRSEPAGPTVDERYIYVGSSGANGLLVLDRRNGDLVRTLSVML